MGGDNQVKAAVAVLHAHLDALNRRDEDALADTLHFPHYRLSEGELEIWETPDAYFEDFRKRAGATWGFTKWGFIEPIQVGSDKVHLAVTVERFRNDQTPLSSFLSLWVISRLNGKWAAQLRSSFAEDSVLASRV